MVYINLSLNNPWAKRSSLDFKILKDKTIQLTPHKFLYIGFQKVPGVIVGISFDLTPFRRCHAGFHFSISLLNRFLEIEFYDDRHWDLENNNWEKEEE